MTTGTTGFLPSRPCIGLVWTAAVFLIFTTVSSQASALDAEDAGPVGSRFDLLDVMLRRARGVVAETDSELDVLNDKLGLLQDVLWALQKATNFFAEDYSAINVDGLFGVRLAQGSLVSVLEECRNGQLSCPKHLVEKLETFVNKIQVMARKAEPYIKSQDPYYFTNFHSTFDKPYILTYRPEILGEGRLVPKTNINYDEEKGDACLNLLIGTGKITNDSLTAKHAPKCTITKDCWEFMSTPDQDRYSVTHQLLYFIFIDKYGCEEAARDHDPHKDPEVLRKMERSLCRDILGEVRNEYREGNVNILSQDLFLEQVVLCGMVGFEDFFADDYIRMVLSWQYPSGCFSMAPSLIGNILGPTHRHSALARLKQEAHDIRHAPLGTARKLMREKQMDGDCLAHKTGLGFGTLGAFMRYLMSVVYSTAPHTASREDYIV